MRNVFPQTVFIDHIEHRVIIDGITIPWYLAEAPVIEQRPDGFPMILHMQVYVDGIVMIQTPNGREIHDPVLGNVREYAKNYVRTEIARVYPWLKLPE